jgi:hypothetical protein
MVSQGQVIYAFCPNNGKKTQVNELIQTLIPETKIPRTIILIVFTLKTRHQYKTPSLLT